MRYRDSRAAHPPAPRPALTSGLRGAAPRALRAALCGRGPSGSVLRQRLRSDRVDLLQIVRREVVVVPEGVFRRRAPTPRRPPALEGAAHRPGLAAGAREGATGGRGAAGGRLAVRRTRRRLRPPAWDVWALGRCVGHHRPPMWGRGMDAVTAGADALWCDSSGGRSRAVASGTALGAASSAQLLCFSPSFSILLPTPSIPPPRLPTSDNTRGHAARHHGLYPRDDVPPSPAASPPAQCSQ